MLVQTYTSCQIQAEHYLKLDISAAADLGKLLGMALRAWSCRANKANFEAHLLANCNSNNLRHIFLSG